MDKWDYDYLSLCGKRDTNQDRVLITDNIIMVLDGHGYHNDNKRSLHVVDLIIKYLPGILDEKINKLQPGSDPDTIIEIIKDCCLNVDEFVYNKYQNVIGGTTMTGVICVQEKIFVVNIGDSETIVVNGIIPIIATVRHKPTDKDELDRITSRGGFVANKRVNGNLAISRVFGDYNFGKINLDGSFNDKSPVWAMADVIHLDEKYTNIFLYSDGLGDHIDLSTLITVAFTNKNDDQKENNMSIKLANAIIDVSSDNITVVSITPKKNGSFENKLVKKDDDSFRLPGQNGEEHCS